MEKKVFVFCIGGTGLRVMKSVAMLLAAGMDTNGYTVVPLLYDPHLKLAERSELQSLLAEYESIRQNLTQENSERKEWAEGFFATDIYADPKRLRGLQNDISDSLAVKQSFGQYLDAGVLTERDPNSLLLKTLFSQANLDNNLSVGFKGSPNVGTVVLGADMRGSNWFKSFCDSFQKGDRIFIISSIFGGTGAAGFPLLDKMIATAKDNPQLSNAVRGAVTVLPYFKLDDPSKTGSDIDWTSFFTKTKAALSYYEDYVKPDYLYYAGEQNLATTYANDEDKQEDKAHFIELVAATALLDFLKKADKPETPQALARAIKEDKEVLEAAQLGNDYNDVVKSLTDMMLLWQLVNRLPGENWFPLKKTRRFDHGFYNDAQFKTLREFLDKFKEWYDELKTNKRAFAPVNWFGLEGKKGPWSSCVPGFTLDAKDETWILQAMICESKKEKHRVLHDWRFRRFMTYAYGAINKFTGKINPKNQN